MTTSYIDLKLIPKVNQTFIYIFMNSMRYLHTKFINSNKYMFMFTLAITKDNVLRFCDQIYAICQESGSQRDARLKRWISRTKHHQRTRSSCMNIAIARSAS